MPQTNSKHVAFMYCFDDLREAKEGIDDAVMVGTKVHTSFITQVEFATAIRSYGTAEFDTTYYDGQVVFVAQLTGDATAADEQKIAEEVKILTAEYGEISKMAEGQAVDGGYEYRVEYFKITEARKALESLTADKTVEKKVFHPNRHRHMRTANNSIRRAALSSPRRYQTRSRRRQSVVTSALPSPTRRTGSPQMRTARFRVQQGVPRGGSMRTATRS